MPLYPVRVVLLFILLSVIPALRAETVSRTPPECYGQQIAPLLTPLDQVLAGRTAFPKADSHGTLLLDEVVLFRDAQGIDYRVYHDVRLSHDDSATETMGNTIFTYDREHESIFLITAATIRPDGTRQEADDRATFIQSPQHQAENGLYTSNLELNLIFPKIVPGAITESIVIVRIDHPVFPGEMANRIIMTSGWPTYLSRLVLELPEKDNARLHLVASSTQIPEAETTALAGERVRKTWARQSIPALDWEESAPSMEFRGPTLWLTTLDSWDQVAAWFDDLVKDRSELGPDLEKELESWTAGLTAPREIVAKLCAVVSNDVRYTGLEFGLAGYQPYPCAKVWANRYGDCKDKANLLRALLAKKGIHSHLVLLQTDRLGRLEARSPSWKQFSHCILAVENGDGSLYFCDPTIKHLPAGQIGRSDSARKVLVVRNRQAEWVQTPDVLTDAIRYDAELTLAPSGELSGWFTLKAQGGDAAAYADYYNDFDPPERRRTLQSSLEGFFQGAEIIDLDYKPHTGVVTDFTIRAFFIRKPNSTQTETIAFPYTAGWLPKVGTVSRKFPYATTRRTETLDIRIALPEGWNARQLPEAFRAHSPVAQFDASWQSTPGKVQAKMKWQPEAAEIAPADYAVFQRSVRALRSWLEQPAHIAHAELATTTGHTTLENFPVLATGAGQMSLLAQRYPSGKDNIARRAALTQVLQWFPDDVATCFEAKVFIALIDGSEDNAKLAREIEALLSQPAPQISLESRTWAKYLAARAQWWADKNPAAIKDLQAVAADKQISNYRRTWCAYYAAAFLAEKEPATALDYLKDFDTIPEEARENMVDLEARLLARLTQPALTRQWAERHLKLQPEQADALFASAFTELIKQHDNLPENALAQLSEILTPILQANSSLTKASGQLARIKALAATADLRAAFVKTINAWVKANPRPWTTKKKSTQFKDTDALLAYLKEKDAASQGQAVIDASLQLIRFHETDYPTFAKYAFWTVWWLHHDKIEPDFLAKIAEASFALPIEEASDIVEIWLKYALAQQADKKVSAARATYEKIIAHAGVAPYQRVEASGELALLELAEGKTDAALAAFELAAKEHLTHRRGSEYMFIALLLQLELGHYDQAQVLLEEIGKTEPKYREAIRYSDTLKYLLPLANQPEALKIFWQRHTQWQPAWEELLRKYGVAPTPAHQLPLIEDITALQKDIAAAVAAKDTQAWLRHVDQFVRTARWVPLFTSNICEASSNVDGISQALNRDMYEFALRIVPDFPALDVVAQRGARLWQAALLTDLGRPNEARPVARKLFEDFGPSDPIGSAGLRIWLISSKDTEENPVAIAAATAALLENKPTVKRPETVATLSDALFNSHQIGANITLLSRELNHAEIIASTAIKTRLAERLESLRKDSSAGSEFSTQVRSWLKSRQLDWILQVPPLTLEQPRYATPQSDGLYHNTLLSYNEETVCNLRLALDENKPVDLRHRALDRVTGALGYHQATASDYADYFGSILKIKALPDALLAELLSNQTAFLLKFGHPSAAAKLLAAEDNKKLRDYLLKVYDASFAAGRLLEKYDSAKATETCQALLKEPVGPFEHLILKTLFTRMVYAGDAAVASGLVENATALKAAAGASQSASGLRLDWTRHIRREAGNLSFYGQLSEILTKHAKPTPADAKSFLELTWPYNLSRLDHETRGRAIAAYYTGKHASVFEQSSILSLLPSATTFVGNRRELGPDLATMILAAEIDDATRAPFLASTTGMIDWDTPAVRERVVKANQDFLAKADPNATAQTRRVIRMQLASVALRTSMEERPDALFGVRETRDLDRQGVANMQFVYLTSRGQTTEALALLEKTDADALTGSFTFPYARQLLLAQNQPDELKLLTAAAKEKLAADLANHWIDCRAEGILQAVHIARLVNAPELLPEALFEHALSVQGDEFDRQTVRLARANLQQDWAAQRKAANAMLERLDDFYLATYYRGEALFHLGKFPEAKKDLELFASKALESHFLPETERMLAEIAKKPQ